MAKTYSVDTPVNSYKIAMGEQAQPPAQTHHTSLEVVPLALGGYGGAQAPAVNSWYDGEKFPGGFGPTELFTLDYFTLRKRSEQLFTENLYAQGLIGRLVTNEINTGLFPEVKPEELILGLTEDSLADWTETVENRWQIWASDQTLCDAKGLDTFAALQRKARTMAYIGGDVLVVMLQNPRTKLPMVNLIDASRVQTPMEITTLTKGHRIKHGVEIDAQGRHVAYWVQQGNPLDGDYKHTRLPAFGRRSGRRNAWLHYGSGELRHDDCRGVPMLGVILQSLKEIDRYRDSTQRKAVVNSIMAMFIKKTDDKPGTLPMQNGAVRNGQYSVGQNDSTTSTRNLNTSAMIPGLVAEELQTGEEPVLLGGQGTDVNFATFEDAIISAVAWSRGVPPEILKLSFSSNYSASQAAINEFKVMLRMVWGFIGDTFCTPIYKDWFLSEVLLGKIEADTYLASLRDPTQYDIRNAWTSVMWYGTVKPSTDTVKQTKGSKAMVDEGWSTNAREARELNGSKFTKNIKQLARENRLKVEAARPLKEFEDEFGEQPDDVLDRNGQQRAEQLMDELDAMVDDKLGDMGVGNG